MLGTNPIAFAAPARRNRHFLLDMSTSTVAQNKVKVYDLQGRPLPPGWVLDEDGNAGHRLGAGDGPRDGATTPAASRALGGTAEMSSHKGYGLSVMVQILSATLAGGIVHADPQAHAGARRPGQHRPLPHGARSDGVPRGGRVRGRPRRRDRRAARRATDRRRASRCSSPASPRRSRARSESATGIPVPDSLADKIRAICERAGAPFLLGAG